MPVAICKHGHAEGYRNTRGTHITEMRCNVCGERVVRAKWSRDGQFFFHPNNNVKAIWEEPKKPVKMSDEEFNKYYYGEDGMSLPF